MFYYFLRPHFVPELIWSHILLLKKQETNGVMHRKLVGSIYSLSLNYLVQKVIIKKKFLLFIASFFLDK